MHLDGDALVLCEGCYGSTDGKTAHGLVRFTRRYRVRAVIDSTLAPADAGDVLDGRHRDIPIVASLDEGLRISPPPTHLVVGVATAGGKLPADFRGVIAKALERGLHVDSGLHEFLGDDPEFAAIGKRTGARIRDVRKPPPRSALHFFSGKIAQVDCPRIAILGTDSAIGKRTTAWLLVQALERAGRRAELIGTGQTAWMQGVRFGFILDSTVNDFVAGEIEHAVWSAWNKARPEFIVIEGQGSLIHPAFPGGFELLGAAKPDAVVLQHAPGRREIDGFPGTPLAPPQRHVDVIRLVSGTPTIAITVSREGLAPVDVAAAARDLARESGIAAIDPLADDGASFAALVIRHFERPR
ncbi:MAG: DUF1611 domain-containing protein [Planctomycetes bacterium]|nr:DUF1611 domain-containing protein [Planctomycetota bacterium]MBI3845615.1 DUF1611 domain-containing protein [Planctomycetota bacterium]